MSEPLQLRIQIFDPKQSYGVIDRCLPHWSQAGTISFITWRTWDSIPVKVLTLWLAERSAWLKKHGIEPGADNVATKLQSLDSKARQEFNRIISDRWNEHLDACHGACFLKRSKLSQIVADSLCHFDGHHYDLTDFVIMPNHVHLLVAFPDDQTMLEQCNSWKHFTATRINQLLNRKGRFWQQDGFDHLVRSLEQFQMLRRYIADNPKRARLSPGEFIHWSKQL